jgi:murein DD-endopeptidase MepM/ murein hydrolase activator NlpD
MMRRCLAISAGTMLLILPALAEPFSFHPPGDLPANTGTGNADLTVYAPNMRFPIEEAPAYANSQVYGHGGVFGPGGRECDMPNFSYPWRDTFCEKRSNPQVARACPQISPVHQGVDIRAKTCERNKHWAVAVEDGIVVSIGSYSLYLVGSETGIKYTYLHMEPSSLQVATHNFVKKGQRLGRVSNVMPPDRTTTHLHFEIQLPSSNGFNFASPYMSLVMAYQRLLAESSGGTTSPSTPVAPDVVAKASPTVIANPPVSTAPPASRPQPKPPKEAAIPIFGIFGINPNLFSSNPGIRME